jgi:hypothetical protein
MSCRSDLNRGLFVLVVPFVASGLQSRGSIRYAMFKNLDDALSAGVGSAWRKDRESR